MLAWVTNVLTSPDLNIEFNTDSKQTPRLIEIFVYEATGTPPLMRFFGPGKTMLKENRVIGGVF